MMRYNFQQNETGTFGLVSRYTQDKVFNQISHILSRIPGRITPKALEKILRIAESLDRNGESPARLTG